MQGSIQVWPNKKDCIHVKPAMHIRGSSTERSNILNFDIPKFSLSRCETEVAFSSLFPSAQCSADLWVGRECFQLNDSPNSPINIRWPTVYVFFNRERGIFPWEQRTDCIKLHPDWSFVLPTFALGGKPIQVRYHDITHIKTLQGYALIKLFPNLVNPCFRKNKQVHDIQIVSDTRFTFPSVPFYNS